MTAGELAARARRLAWLLFDVDGTLTDGRLYYGAGGLTHKSFDSRDGLGIKLAQRAGLKVGALSGRADAAFAVRAAELGFDLVLAGVHDKGAALDRFLAERSLETAQVAYVGDDLPDLPVLARAGLSFAPADADAAVRGRVDAVLASAGGRGAAREAVEIVLRARGEWEQTVAALLGFEL
jgi:3-deoxy-D-manno-octulosonate 8-phosphate phosphatase (KDO 8-P phosphatase)